MKLPKQHKILLVSLNLKFGNKALDTVHHSVGGGRILFWT
jgi:hypothetical protein